MMTEQSNILNTYKAYIVTLQADDGCRKYYYIFAPSPDQAKELACQYDVAPPGAVLNVRLSDFERAAR